MINNVHVFEPNIKWLFPGVTQSASRNSATMHSTLEVTWGLGQQLKTRDVSVRDLRGYSLRRQKGNQKKINFGKK